MLRPGFRLLATTVMLAGCSVGPDYFPPDPPLPANFAADKREASWKPHIVQWWWTLNDPQLNDLVDRAIACNLDIEIALTRVQKARMQEVVVRQGRLPEVGVSGGIAAGSGTDLTKGRVANSLRSGSSTSGLDSLQRIVGFDGRWDLDLFGKYRRLLEAAEGDTEALAEMRNAVLVTVVSDVVLNYVQIAALQSRLEYARRDVATARGSVNLTRTRFDRGITSELDVALAERHLATLQARIPDLESAIFATKSRLALLLDTFPEAIIAGLGIARIPALPDDLDPRTPMDLLRTRPDIRYAERRLAAANARIGAATADLFPSVGLTTGFGVQGGPGRGTPSSGTAIHGSIWSVGPSGYWPFLDFGRLDALIAIEEMQTHEELVGYKKAILTAVGEVDMSLVAYHAARRRLRALNSALSASRRAVQLATERYDRGLTDFLNVLDAQRQMFEMEDLVVVSRERVALEYIGFYKALGGGWEGYQALPPLPRPEPAFIAMFRRIAAQHE